MIAHTSTTHRHVDFREKIDALAEQTKTYPRLCAAPKRIEFTFCALLAGWESTARHDSKAAHWLELWQEACRKRHHGNIGRTLADPVNAAPLSERWGVSKAEKARAFKQVRDGLRKVLEATLNHYHPEQDKGLSFEPGEGEADILLQKILASLKSTESLDGPEGLEMFLLTLVESFEESLGGKEDDLFCHKAWRAEICRRRLGGSPETRTLADVAPPDVRLKRQNALSEKERLEIVRKMVSSVQQIAAALQRYLQRHGT